MRQLIGWTESPRGRGIFAGIVTVAVIVTVTGIYHVFAPRSSAVHATGTPTPTFAALPGPRGQWVTVSGMSGGIPAIAPSDPRVVYEVFDDNWFTDAGPPVLKRSSDGGATWQALTIPGGQVQAGTSSGTGLNVHVIPSPTDSNLVFLTVGVPYPRNCPTWPPDAHYQTNATGTAHASMLSTGLPESGYIQCSYEYRSDDGGHTWQQITLPAGGQLFPASVRPIGSNLALYAQGNRLYSVDQGDHGEQHLVRSDDGGITWQVIDLPQAELTAGGQMFVDYKPAPTGSMVFATTSDSSNFALWRSDNAGASWRQVIGSFPDNGYTNMQVVDRAGNTVPLIYIAQSVQDDTSPTGDAARFEVSTDGGATWTSVPTNGLLPASQIEPSLQGVLADGSILVEGPPPSPSGPSALIFYAWKVGQSTWRQIAPGVVSGRLVAITAPDASGHQALWVIAGDESQVQRCVLE